MLIALALRNERYHTVEPTERNSLLKKAVERPAIASSARSLPVAFATGRRQHLQIEPAQIELLDAEIAAARKKRLDDQAEELQKNAKDSDENKNNTRD